jgi:hypothetical protein
MLNENPKKQKYLNLFVLNEKNMMKLLLKIMKLDYDSIIYENIIRQ